MKRCLACLSLLLISHLPARGAELSGEVEFYNANLERSYQRKTGYDKWRGTKSGFLYKLKAGEKFKVGENSTFYLTVTSGTPKAPYLSILTPSADRLFDRDFKSYNIDEMFFKTDGLLSERVSLSLGKQRFTFPLLMSDRLWGGTLKLRATDNLFFTWYQIAGYEGSYMLKEEDDIDIFGGGAKWTAGKTEVEGYLIKLSDARGKRAGVNKNTLILSVKRKAGRLRVSFSSALQNGRSAFGVTLKGWNAELLAGYAEKGFTSYGFREHIRDTGYIFKPAFSGCGFVRVSSAYRLRDTSLKLHYTYTAKSNRRLIGNEWGGEVSHPFYGGELFLRLATGTGGSSFFSTGYRWGIRTHRQEGAQIAEVKGSFATAGEYLDPGGRDYTTWNGYEGWDSAEHIGYWHSTLKLSVSAEHVKAKISTGPNSKVDYVVWGNTSDNYLYSRTHGKLWHLEELSYTQGNLKMGLQEVHLPGFVRENLAGVSRAGRFSAGLFLEEHGKVEKGSNCVRYATLFAELPFVLPFYMHRWNGKENQHIYGASAKFKWVRAGYIRETGDTLSRAWGAFAQTAFKFKGLSGGLTYRVYSEKFKTFGMKEDFREAELAYRPGESNIRVLTAKLWRELRVSGFAPVVSVSYGRLLEFSGDYIGEEAGLSISFKVTDRSRLKLKTAVGNKGSHYEGVTFELKW